MDVQIRRAKLEDAGEIANVHINTWREAYRDLMPKAYLDDRPLAFKNRHALWTRVIGEGQSVHVAESPQFGVVGVGNGGAGRDDRFPGHGEIYCLYLFEKFHHRGLGFQLLKACFQDLVAQGHRQAYLWVLENNPSISFYQKTGARLREFVQSEVIMGLEVRELCYEWTDLQNLYTDPT